MRTACHQGSTLEYLTVLPDDYEEGAAYPLMVCLHGFGANMHDLTGLVSALFPAGYLYAFPNGPVALDNMGIFDGRAWHERGGHESPEEVNHAIATLNGFMHEVIERYRVPTGKVLLLGFSQGGALALRYGLPRPDLFAGLAVLSNSLRQVEELGRQLPDERTQPVFIAHGIYDTLVPIETSQKVVEFLKQQKYQPVFRSYAVDHQISPQLVKDLREWIGKVLPPMKQA